MPATGTMPPRLGAGLEWSRNTSEGTTGNQRWPESQKPTSMQLSGSGHQGTAGEAASEDGDSQPEGKGRRAPRVTGR